jgi:MSHA pilin protein MshD
MQLQQTPLAQRGFSLIELIIFMVVVSAAMAGVLTVLNQSAASSADPQLRRQALAIAESLLEEVQRMPFTFCDPDDPAVFTASSAAGCAVAEAMGPESGETRTGATKFDNVNDYHGFTLASPPGISDSTGAVVPGLERYAASISVQAAALDNIPAAGDALRITVTVNGPGNTQVRLEGWRTRHSPHAPHAAF